VTIAAEVRKLVRYLLGKRTELDDLDLSDIVMAKAIHTLDRDTAIAATRRRISAVAPRDRRHATSGNRCGSMPFRGATLSGLAR
jgi:hypothetical protein